MHDLVVMENKRAKMGRFQRNFEDLKKNFSLFQSNLQKKAGIWSTSIQEIESKFGLGISSYFILYRWVFVLNCFLAFFWFFFIILWDIIYLSSNNNEGWRNLTSLDYGVQNFFQGTGGYQKTILFYGSYPSVVKNPYLSYSMDSAYLAIIFVFFITSFIAIVRRVRFLYVSR